MSSIDKDGGPAFGQVVELKCVRVEMDGASEWEPEAMMHGGLTVRDYHAAHSPIDLPDAYKAWRDAPDYRGQEPTRTQVYALLAAMRHEYADAMIAARPHKEESE